MFTGHNAPVNENSQWLPRQTQGIVTENVCQNPNPAMNFHRPLQIHEDCWRAPGIHFDRWILTGKHISNLVLNTNSQHATMHWPKSMGFFQILLSPSFLKDTVWGGYTKKCVTCVLHVWSLWCSIHIIHTYVIHVQNMCNIFIPFHMHM